MILKCTTEEISEVIKHEEKMLYEYKCTADKYKEEFMKYQCMLRLKMEWYNCISIKQRVSDHRIPLESGYVCYINFSVQRNGKDVKLKSNDGEADYYILSDSLHITEINWRLSRNKIVLYSDIEDFEEELDYFMQMLITHTFNTVPHQHTWFS